ncbi:tRNA (adenosine(37)-N6)-threonylcarbamoyltransferase complex ATPase subunit type 1 TsaE [soil metagenome]
MNKTSLWLPDAAATDALGQRLAATQPAQAVVHLYGELGAGKSTLARAWLRALGVEGPIRSPTYTLVERYPLLDGGEALHLDLYRIGDAGELEFLALDESPARLWLVEWPQRGLAALPSATLRVSLSVEGGGRRCLLQGCDQGGHDWLATEAENLRLQEFHEQ